MATDREAQDQAAPASDAQTAQTEAGPATLLGGAVAAHGGASVRRKIARRLQRRAAGGSAPTGDQAAQAVDRAAGTTGAPLPAQLQGRFEGALGADLSAVRVHSGAESQAAAAGVEARAYTVGQDIHFAAGQFSPGTRSGDELIAHEVAHTVQQAGASAPGPQHKLEVSDPGDVAEHEADDAARTMVEGGRATVSGATGIARTSLHRAVGWGDAAASGHNAATETVGHTKRVPIDGLTSITIVDDHESAAAVSGTQPAGARRGAPPRREGSNGRAVVCFPENLNPAAVEVLLHMHGHNVGYRQRASTSNDFPWLRAGEVRDVSVDRIEQQIEGAGRPMIGMLPQGTSLSDFNPVAGRGSGFNSDAFINEVLGRLVSEGFFPTRPNVVGVVMSGHSGGSHGLSEAMMTEAGTATRTGRMPSQYHVNEVILFDAINGDSEVARVMAWLRMQLERDRTALAGMAGDEARQLAYLGTSMRFRLFFTGGYDGSAAVSQLFQQQFEGGRPRGRAAAATAAVLTRWHDNYRAERTTAASHDQEIGSGQLQSELSRLPPVQAPPPPQPATQQASPPPQQGPPQRQDPPQQDPLDGGVGTGPDEADG